MFAGTTISSFGWDRYVTLPCVIIVDDNCSLANAIRSANGNTQVTESGDTDGNDDCEDGGDPDDITLPGLTPATTSSC